MRIRGLPQALSLAALTVGTLEVTGAATFAETVTAMGQFLAGNGSAGAPSYSFTNDPDCGLYRIGADSIGMAIGGNLTIMFGGLNSEILVRGIGSIAHSGSMFSITAGSGDVQIGPYGVAGTMNLTTAGSTRWTVTAAGHLIPAADNTYNLGDDTHRIGTVRAVYVYTDGFIMSTEAFRLTNVARIQPGPGDGIVTFTMYGGSDFDRLCFGGTTSAFPSLKRFGANLVARLADDSGPANFYASNIVASGYLLSNMVYDRNSVKILGDQGAAVADAAGGATVDAEARTAINTLLARLRAHGLIST